MLQIHQEYLTDENGNKKAVVISLTEWQEILEELDDNKLIILVILIGHRKEIYRKYKE